MASEPDYAEALACLSLVYSNAFRFRHPIDAPDPDPRDRAIALAARAVELAPSSSWARYALGLARWFAGNAAAALEALEAGTVLNPNDTTILADLGQRYAMLARWDEAVPLLEESYAANPAQPGSYRIGLFLYHFARGRFAEALAEARRVDAPQVLYGHVAVAAAAGRARPRRRGGGRGRRDPRPGPRLWRACRRRPREPAPVAGARPPARRGARARPASSSPKRRPAWNAGNARPRHRARSSSRRAPPTSSSASPSSALFAWWSLELVRPFVPIVIWAILLAVALYPAYAWLARRLGDRRGLAATVITLISLVTVLGPVSVLATSLAESVQWLASGLASGTPRDPAAAGRRRTAGRWSASRSTRPGRSPPATSTTP